MVLISFMISVKKKNTKKLFIAHLSSVHSDEFWSLFSLMILPSFTFFTGFILSATNNRCLYICHTCTHTYAIFQYIGYVLFVLVDCFNTFNTFATSVFALNFFSVIKFENVFECGFFNLLFSQKCGLACFEMMFLLVLNLLEQVRWSCLVT